MSFFNFGGGFGGAGGFPGFDGKYYIIMFR